MGPKGVKHVGSNYCTNQAGKFQVGCRSPGGNLNGSLQKLPDQKF